MDDEAMIGAGVDVPDPMPDIEAQDDAPAESEARPVATSGPALLKMFQAERATQGDVVRGPVRVPLVDPATLEPSDAIVYYRRLTREDKARFKTLADEAEKEGGTAADLNWIVFIERALDKDGRRLLSGVSYEEARNGNWNDEAVSDAVYAMNIGSRTILTQADLGNSSTSSPGSG